MRLLLSLMFLSLIYLVYSKNSNVKSLTESMGQEVIEIGTPIKELPMGLEEEPAAENEDEDEKHKSTSTTLQPVTRKETKRITTITDVRKNMKDIEKIDGLTQDDEEARIEKELAEIYKDTDYKADNEEKEIITEVPANDLPTEEYSSGKEESADETDKPVARQRTNFKFEPDTTNKADIERFRTSIDEINCNFKQKLKGSTTPGTKSSKAINTISNGLAFVTAMSSCVFLWS